MTKTDTDALALRLQHLRDREEQVETASFDASPDIAQAIAVQQRLTFSGPVKDAWKVARSPDGAGVSARLHPVVEGAAGQSLPWRQGVQLEIEIAVRLAIDLPPVTSETYQRDDILAAIDTVHLGAELVRSVLIEGSKVSYPLFLSDRLGNDGYVLGPAISRDFLDPAHMPTLTVTAAGKVIFAAEGQHPTGDTLTWLLDFANQPGRAAGTLPAGALITTGSLCGIISITERGQITADLAGAPSFSFLLS